MTDTFVVKKTMIRNNLIAVVAGIIATIALPQLFHLLGIVSGAGAAFGALLLPMQLPVLLAGFFAGPIAGLLVGLSSPLVSFGLSGMPSTALLPFMMVELAVYGAVAGLLGNVKMPMIAKVVVVQIAGRVVRIAAVAGALLLQGNATLDLAKISGFVVTGLPGILLQIALIPLLVFWIEHRNHDDK